MSQNKKRTEYIAIAAVVGYFLLTIVSAWVILSDAYGCVSDGVSFDTSETSTAEQAELDECLADAESSSNTYTWFIYLTQGLATIGLVYWLVKHGNNRREQYGHNTVQNAQLEHQMQQQSDQQVPPPATTVPPAQEVDHNEQSKQ